MEIKKELKNGFFIFIAIGTYFLIIEFLGLSNHFYLRFFNIFILLYGVNNTIQSRLAEGENKFFPNIISAMLTSVIGVGFAIGGLIIYSHMKGGDAYIQNLSESFLFGGDPSINMYTFSLFIEGLASSIIVTLSLMLYNIHKFRSDKP